MTADDSQNATISLNTIQGCRGDGILLVNGAVLSNQPWLVSGNQMTNNSVEDAFIEAA